MCVCMLMCVGVSLLGWVRTSHCRGGSRGVLRMLKHPPELGEANYLLSYAPINANPHPPIPGACEWG